MKLISALITSSFIAAISTRAIAVQPQQPSDADLKYMVIITQLLTKKNNALLNEVAPRTQLETGCDYCAARRSGVPRKKMNEFFAGELFKLQESTRSDAVGYVSSVVTAAEFALCPEFLND